jgi:hypothetical protein
LVPLYGRRAAAALVALTCLAAGRAGAFDPTPADVQRLSIGRTLGPADWPALVQLPDTPFAAGSLGLDARQLLATPSEAAPPPRDAGDVAWRFDYTHSLLTDTMSNQLLRNDRSTGFSRQLDRDVVDLGLSWRLAGNRLGIGYQLQSARERSAADLSLARFLPGNAQATHALTLGLTREWGAGTPPPVPIVLLPELAGSDEATSAAHAAR